MKKIRGLKTPALPRLSIASLPATLEASQRLLGIAFTLGALILAAWWLTQLTAPRPVAKLPSAPMALPDNSTMMIIRLFGVGQVRSESIEGLRLTGIYAGSRSGGFATFNSKKGAISVFVGDEIVPGVKLKTIERDRVIVLTSGAQQELQLQGSSGSATSPSTQTTSQPTIQTPSQPTIQSRTKRAAQQHEED